MNNSQVANSHGDEFALNLGLGAEVEAVDLYQTSGTSPPNPMPALAPDEYEALKASIHRHGVLQPIIVDLEGNVLDGHHRLAIFRESFHTSTADPSECECDIADDGSGGGPRLPFVIVTDKQPADPPAGKDGRGLKGGAMAKWYRENPTYANSGPYVANLLSKDDEFLDLASYVPVRLVVVPSYDKDDLARTLNFDRRHLTVEQRRSLVAELRAKGTSIRGIAKATGAPKSVVADDVKQLSGAGQLKEPAKVKGLDGKTRTAKPRKAPAKPKTAPVEECATRSEPLHLAIEGCRVEKTIGVFAMTEGDGTWVVHQATVTADELSPANSRGYVSVPSTVCGEGAVGLAMPRKVRTKSTPDLAEPGMGGHSWFTTEPVNCPKCAATPKAPAKPKDDKPDIKAMAKRVREHRNPQCVFETHLIICEDCGASGVPLAYDSGSASTMCEPCWDKCWAQWSTEAS